MLTRNLLALALLAVLSPTVRVATAEAPDPKPVDFSGAVIVTAPELSAVEQKAVTVLRAEIDKRTGIQLQQTTHWPQSPTAVIALGLQSHARQFTGPFAAEFENAQVPGPEGFTIALKREPRPAVIICAADTRGLLYGVGRLLRKIELEPKTILVPSDLRVATAPKYSLRGTQLGYRPKVNAYDAWTEAQFDQYIRELALFGANSIEILPPRTDDERTSRHMKLPPMEMMVRLSEIIDSYGLDVWVWYPNMGKDYTKEKTIQAELAEREEVFRRLKRIDHILVPGGDPGNLDPDVFFPWIAKVAPVLQKYHPHAKIWVSPQAFLPTHEWLDSFYSYVNQKPKWLGGVAFAPWIATPLPEMRAIVDKSIKIRIYPDITHSVECQYPVPNWDLAFALTLHRECYNPRPVAMKTIHNLCAPYTCGSLAYSEGINDDLNKFIWIDQDWDPTTPVVDTVRDYCRLFITPEFSNDLAQGFFALEKNWEGPLAVNHQVDVTLQQWRELEKAAPSVARDNYRFQMGLLRAYYDAYIKRRLIHETELEAQALDALRLDAARTGSAAAMEKAEAYLQRAQSEPVAPDYKQKCEALADSLFEKIGSQLSVKKSGAQSRTRGAFMDGIDEPLNNVNWLRAQFQRVRELKDEPARLEAIDQILNRTNPGPGGFYDNLGAPGSEKRIVNSVRWEDDPGTLKSPRITFYYQIDQPKDRDIPLAWKKQADTLYDTPLRLAYDNLDPEAEYSVRATYSGHTSRSMRLVANGTHVIRDHIEAQNPPVQEFQIPREATRGGHLELAWSCGQGERSTEVAEVWLIKHATRPRTP
jgi:hypothetical protein